MLGALPSRIAVILHLEPPKTTPAEVLVWECLLPALSSSISHRVFLEGWTKQGGITLTKTSVDPWRRFFWIFAKGLERNCFLVASSKKNNKRCTVCQRCVVGWQLETKRSLIQRGWDVWSWFQRARVHWHGVLMSQPGSLWSKRLAASRKDISYRRFRVIVQDL